MSIATIKNKVNDFKTGLVMGVVTGANMVAGVTPVHAFDSATISINSGTTPQQAMGAVIGVILTIMRYVGVAMVIYGVYEVVMSIQNNQPEAKTKGIIMALSGVVMISIKTLLSAFGISV